MRLLLIEGETLDLTTYIFAGTRIILFQLTDGDILSENKSDGPRGVEIGNHPKMLAGSRRVGRGAVLGWLQEGLTEETIVVKEMRMVLEKLTFDNGGVGRSGLRICCFVLALANVR